MIRTLVSPSNRLCKSIISYSCNHTGQNKIFQNTRKINVFSRFIPYLFPNSIEVHLFIIAFPIVLVGIEFKMKEATAEAMTSFHKSIKYIKVVSHVIPMYYNMQLSMFPYKFANYTATSMYVLSPTFSQI